MTNLSPALRGALHWDNQHVPSVADTLAWNLPCQDIVSSASVEQSIAPELPALPSLGPIWFESPPEAFGGDTTAGCLAPAAYPGEGGTLAWFQQKHFVLCLSAPNAAPASTASFG